MSSQDTPASAAPTIMTKAEKEATVAAGLDLKSTVLIGIVGKTDALSALLRNANGSIVKVTRGDKTTAGTVIGIDGQSVSLQKSGKVRVLRMPQT